MNQSEKKLQEILHHADDKAIERIAQVCPSVDERTKELLFSRGANRLGLTEDFAQETYQAEIVRNSGFRSAWAAAACFLLCAGTVSGSIYLLKQRPASETLPTAEETFTETAMQTNVSANNQKEKETEETKNTAPGQTDSLSAVRQETTAETSASCPETVTEASSQPAETPETLGAQTDTLAEAVSQTAAQTDETTSEPITVMQTETTTFRQEITAETSASCPETVAETSSRLAETPETLGAQTDTLAEAVPQTAAQTDETAPASSVEETTAETMTEAVQPHFETERVGDSNTYVLTAVLPDSAPVTIEQQYVLSWTPERYTVQYDDFLFNSLTFHRTDYFALKNPAPEAGFLPYDASLELEDTGTNFIHLEQYTANGFEWSYLMPANEVNPVTVNGFPGVVLINKGQEATAQFTNTWSELWIWTDGEYVFELSAADGLAPMSESEQKQKELFYDSVGAHYNDSKYLYFYHDDLLKMAESLRPAESIQLSQIS